MARSVTLQSIADRARLYADMRNSGFVDDDEMLILLNDAYTELYDMLVSANENYYVTTGDEFNVSSATGSYALPDDFYKLVGVDFSSGNSWVTLVPYQEAERNLPIGTSNNLPSGRCRVRYVPAPQVFTSLSDEVDGISGWDQLLALEVATILLDAEETNSDRVTRRLDRMKARIIGSYDRDIGMPCRVTDIHAVKPTSNIRYRLYGNNIELVSQEIIGFDDYGAL